MCMKTMKDVLRGSLVPVIPASMFMDSTTCSIVHVHFVYFILYYTILYYTILYYTILYYTLRILHSIL